MATFWVATLMLTLKRQDFVQKYFYLKTLKTLKVKVHLTLAMFCL